MYSHLVGLENGVFNLETGELVDYEPGFYLTARVPHEYNPRGTCPQFFDYMETVTPDIVDRMTMIDYGAALAIREPLPFMLFLLGLGRNGKGCFENILYELYGKEKFAEIKIDELNESRFATGSLKDKWCLIITESGNNRGRNTLDTRIVKKITGGDFLDSDRKNRSRIRFRATCRIIIDLNLMPSIDDRSRGIEERFCKTNLPYSFLPHPKKDRPDEKLKDPRMYQKTTTEEELQGIIAVFIERGKEIWKAKEIVRHDPEATFEAYHDQSASINAFLDKFCDYEPSMNNDVLNGTPPNVKLYEYFCEWCTVTVASKASDKKFFKILKEYCGKDLPTKKRGEDGRFKYQKGLTFYEDEFNLFMLGAKTRLEAGDLIDEGEEEKKASKIWYNLAARFGGARHIKIERILDLEFWGATNLVKEFMEWSDFLRLELNSLNFFSSEAERGENRESIAVGCPAPFEGCSSET